jgi:hypothetical protein
LFSSGSVSSERSRSVQAYGVESFLVFLILGLFRFFLLLGKWGPFIRFYCGLI